MKGKAKAVKTKRTRRTIGPMVKALSMFKDDFIDALDTFQHTTGRLAYPKRDHMTPAERKQWATAIKHINQADDALYLAVDTLDVLEEEISEAWSEA